MPRKYTVILALLVIVPLLAFFFLGMRLIEADQLRMRQQFDSLLDANLSGVDRTVAAYFDKTQRKLLDADIDLSSTTSIRAFVRSQPLVEQILLLGDDGLPLYPSGADPYLQKMEQLIADRTFVRSRLREQIKRTNETISRLGGQPVKVIIHAQDERSESEAGLNGPDSNANANGNLTYAEPTSQTEEYGWYTWYWGNGLQLMHWQVLDDHRTLIMGLSREHWIEGLTAVLPTTDPDSQNRTTPSQVRLLDADGEVVYFWGGADLPTNATPAAMLHLSSPLRPWQLQHFGLRKPFAESRSATLINLLGTGGLLFLGLLGLVLVLSREIGRQSREARQRVSFVNQVSHELKTPLTNIRMYADLLENDLERIDPEDEKAQSHLAVITSESSRLSRLINNVLTFARTNRDVKAPLRRAHSVDQIIEQVLQQFGPSLRQLEIDVVLDLDAPQQVLVDSDVLEQMLGNLISNVEKYAASGRHLRLASRHKNNVSTVTVSDAGPGISASFAKRIFSPFERASDQIVAATGTGIGLSITRRLAQRHGGDLMLVDSAIGATFRLTLETPLCDG